MHTEDFRESVESKLLPFPGAAALRGVSGAAGPDDFSLVPHDIAMLARPSAVEMLSAKPAIMQERDGLAHDARNLVTALELFSGLLDEPGVLPEEHKHFAGDLKTVTVALSSLVERMAHEAPVTRQQGEPVFVREPLRPALATGKARRQEENDAGLMVKSSERLLAAIAGPTVALNVSYERGLGELSLDGESLTRVLMNLVKNASEAMAQGGRIAITVRRGLGAKSSAIVSVQDNGSGIPAYALGQIFHAGFSSKKSRQKWPATKHYGLGLTIVRELVEEAGGSVRVVSALRKGTTFEIKLPCRRA